MGKVDPLQSEHLYTVNIGEQVCEYGPLLVILQKQALSPSAASVQAILPGQH